MVAEILFKNVILLKKTNYILIKKFQKLHKLIAEKVIKKIISFFGTI